MSAINGKIFPLSLGSPEETKNADSFTALMSLLIGSLLFVVPITALFFLKVDDAGAFYGFLVATAIAGALVLTALAVLSLAGMLGKLFRVSRPDSQSKFGYRPVEEEVVWRQTMVQRFDDIDGVSEEDKTRALLRWADEIEGRREKRSRTLD